MRINLHIDGVPVTIKAYPKVMHTIKCLLPKEAKIPRSIKSAKEKIDAIKRYLREVEERHLGNEMGGYRIEICISQVATIEAAARVALQVCKMMAADLYRIRFAARLDLHEYTAIGWTEVNQCTRVIQGRATDPLSDAQQQCMARLYNAIGYHSGRWYRLIQPQQIEPQQQPAIEPPQDAQLDPATVHAIQEAVRCLRTRPVAKNRSLLCAMYANGACTRGFSTVQALARWAVLDYNGNWWQDFKLQDEPAPPPASISICTLI